jgi:hypothetical protein
VDSSFPVPSGHRLFAPLGCVVWAALELALDMTAGRVDDFLERRLPVALRPPPRAGGASGLGFGEGDLKAV